MARDFKIKASTVHERFGDESVIVNLDSGSYYSAQGTADFVWALVADGASESQILDRMTTRFTGDRDEIIRTVTEFLTHLASENLVEPVASGANGTASPETVDAKTGQTFVAPILQKYTDMEELLRLDPIHEVDEVGWPVVRGKTA